MRSILFLMLLFFLLGGVLPTAPQPSWTLVWSDEFDGPDNSAPEPLKWGYDIGGGGWGNKELETYTQDRRNAFRDGHGNLAIRAIKDASGGYTSARLKTKGLFEFQYGKIEARIKLPQGDVWPAFWLLGNDISRVSWPKCGELDVAEQLPAKEPSVVHATVHGPGYSGGHGITAQTSLPGGATLGDDFHVYGMIWSHDTIEFFLDGRSYSSVTRASLPTGAGWVFDHPFFVLLNVAVGGEWPGYPTEKSVFPQTMLIDWVRVWQSSLEPRPPGSRGGK